MYFKKLTWLIPCIICACATPLKEDSKSVQISSPPSIQIDDNKDPLSVIYYLEGLRKNSADSAMQVWAEYKLATLYQENQDPRACQLYNQLSQNKEFPLHNEAQLRHLKSCINENVKSSLDKIKLLSEKPWLKHMGLEASIELAEKFEMNEELIDFYLEKSKLPLDINEKVKYTQKALKIATKHFPQEKWQIKKRLETLSPMNIKRPNFKQYLKVAYDYRRNRKFDQALWFYKAVANKKNIDYYSKIKALTGISRTYKIMGEKEKHIKAAENLALYTKQIFLKNKKRREFAESLHDSYLNLARANWTQGNIRLAKKTLTIMSNLLNKHYPLTQVYLIRARMSEEVGDFTNAITWLNKAYTEAKKDNIKETLLWHIAWNFKKLNKLEDAVATFKELLKMEQFEDNKTKYIFWLAKTLKEQQKFEEANEYFEDAIAEDPYGYYGILAHRETHDLLKLPNLNRSLASETVSNSDKDNLSKYLDTRYLDWLISLDEQEITERYLDHTMDQMKKRDFIENQDWLALFHYYAKAGNFLKLFTQIGKIPPEQRKDLIAENPDLIFPKPYYSEVSEAAQKFGLSVEYIYSIMRQESAFNPKARSHMDAFGLMQLLPEVAGKYAKNNKIKFNKAEDLFTPTVSIHLGAAHLRELWDKYGGRFILATASYNANDKAIQNWLKTRYRGDSLEFIEDVPYKETQGYIKLVMRNLIFYKMVNSSSKVVSFPNWALEI